MVSDKEVITLGNFLDIVYKHFDAIPLSKKKYAKTYVLTSIAYEDSIKIQDFKNQFIIEIYNEGSFITHAVLIERGLFKDKRNSLISESRTFNESGKKFEEKIIQLANLCNSLLAERV